MSGNRKTARSTPKIDTGYLTYREDLPLGAFYNTIAVDSPDFNFWLDRGDTFSYEGLFTARCEKRAKGLYWYAFKKDSTGKLKKLYIGQKDKVTQSNLRSIADRFMAADDPCDPDALKARFGYDLKSIAQYLSIQFEKLHGHSWSWGKQEIEKIGTEYYLRPKDIYLGHYMEAVVAMCNFVQKGKDNAADRRAWQVKRGRKSA